MIKGCCWNCAYQHLYNKLISNAERGGWGAAAGVVQIKCLLIAYIFILAIKQNFLTFNNTHSNCHTRWFFFSNINSLGFNKKRPDCSKCPGFVLFLMHFCEVSVEEWNPAEMKCIPGVLRWLDNYVHWTNEHTFCSYPITVEPRKQIIWKKQETAVRLWN